MGYNLKLLLLKISMNSVGLLYVTNNPEITNEANINVDNVKKGDSEKEKELKD